MSTFQTLQTWIGHVVMFEKLVYSLVSAISAISNVLPHITTHNSTNMDRPLCDALPHALPYIFSGTCLVLGYLQGVTTRDRHFFKKNINKFFYEFHGTRGNALQIASNHATLRENVR